MAKTKKIIDDGFIKWLQGLMLSCVPVKMFTQKFTAPESEQVFYEMVCQTACLRPESPDVKAAFMRLRGISEKRIMLSYVLNK